MTKLYRDWSLARAKCEIEGRCRVCGGTPVETAHLAPREFDDVLAHDIVQVNPNGVVPLDRSCHTAFDAHELDLLPYLSLQEQSDCVSRLGIERAYRRLAPSLFREAVEA